MGSSGTGKTTLCRKIAIKCHLPMLHLDQFYWKKKWEHLSKDEFDGYMKQYLKKHEKWVMDGNYTNNNHFNDRLKLADTIIFLDFGRNAALRGIHERAKKYKHQTRSDMAEGCIEGIDQVFLQYVAFFEEKAKRMKAIIKKYDRSKEILIFKDRETLYKWFDNLC